MSRINMNFSGGAAALVLAAALAASLGGCSFPYRQTDVPLSSGTPAASSLTDSAYPDDDEDLDFTPGFSASETDPALSEPGQPLNDPSAPASAPSDAEPASSVSAAALSEAAASASSPGASSSGTETDIATSDASEPLPIEDTVTTEPVLFDPSWQYAGNSRINSGIATLYHAKPSTARHITVCINAGHGTEGGSSVKTLCHPDGSPKVTGGSTSEGAVEATAIAVGTDFLDGTPEAQVTLALAKVVRETLLDQGYDVLMIRETEDVQLDNIARTLMANNRADCHIALHYDSTDWDKGVYFMSVPSDASYRSMEPVASHWQEHNRLGECITGSIAKEGFSLFEGGALEMDLTQTSYSTVPSIDLECGDRASDHSGSTYPALAAGLAAGLNLYFSTSSN